MAKAGATIVFNDIRQELVDKGLVTNQLVLTVGYDRENLDDPGRRQNYHGPVATDRYGRSIPKHAVVRRISHTPRQPMTCRKRRRPSTIGLRTKTC